MKVHRWVDYRDDPLSTKAGHMWVSYFYFARILSQHLAKGQMKLASVLLGIIMTVCQV